MQKLKRLPLLQRLSNTLKNSLEPVRGLVKPQIKLPKSLTTVAWIALCLLALWLLLGCAPQTRIVRPPLPPQAEAREVPPFEGQTYRDVILYVIELKETAQQSEADKAAIRRVYGRE